MSIVDLGDVYRLSYDHYANGSLATAGAATWTVTLPDGTTSSFAATTTGTGQYRNDYTTVQAGRHVARWVGTGANAGAYSESFNVAAAASLDLMSLAEAKQHLNIASTAHDEELRGFIEACTEVVEELAGETIARRTIVEARTFDHFTTRLALHSVPVISLTAVSDLNGSQTWQVTGFHVDGATGIVTVLNGGTPLHGLVQLTYLAGYQVVPAKYTRAALIVLQDLWTTQRGSRGAPRYAGQGDPADMMSPSVWRQVRELVGDPIPGIA